MKKRFTFKQAAALAVLADRTSSTVKGVQLALDEKGIMIASNGVWQVLDGLSAQGLCAKEHGGQSQHGRPWHRYVVTPQGRETVEQLRRSIS